jgi:hypothetical protein
LYNFILVFLRVCDLVGYVLEYLQFTLYTIFKQQENKLHFYDMPHYLCFVFP